VPVELVAWVAAAQRLPVPNFSAGGVATPADAALMMQLGAEAVFVGSGIFKSAEPQKRARAIVRAVTHYQDPKMLVEVSKGLGEAMPGLEVASMPAHERLAARGI
jgi:pyridoxal 5'-phosphate synthase pdxS subunit